MAATGAPAGPREGTIRKSRFSETQIVEILKEGEAGLPVGELLRRATYFQWKAKYSRATVADLKRLSSRRC